MAITIQRAMPDPRTVRMTSARFGWSNGSPPMSRTRSARYPWASLRKSSLSASGRTYSFGETGDRWLQPRQDKLQWCATLISQ